MAKKYRTGLIIEGDAKGGIKAVRATEKEVRKLENRSGKAARSISTLSRATTHIRRNSQRYALGIAAAATGLATLTARQASAARDTHTLATAIGVSTGSLQEFQYAAEQAGIGADKAADIVKDLSDKIGDAALTGGGELAEVLDKINVSATDLQKLGPTQQLLTISNAIKDLPKAQQVNVLESVADDATRLLPLLRNGGQLLRQYSKEARDFDIALGDDDVDRLLRANRASQRFSGAMRGLGNDIAISVAPALADSIDDMDYLRQIVSDPGFQSSLSTLASAFATTAGFLAEGSREFVEFGQEIGTAAAKLAGYSNELDDIDSKLQRLESMRQSSALSRAGLFNFGDGLDTYIDDSDIDRYEKELKKRRAKILGGMPGSASAAGEPAEAGPEGRTAKADPYGGVAAEYDKRHKKLEKLRADREKLQQAIAKDPEQADLYRRSLTEVNRQIDSLNQGSRSAATALTDQQKATQHLADQYKNTATSLQQQIDLFGKDSQAAKIRYQTEHGELSKLSPARKENLASMAKELDQLQRQKDAVDQLFPAWQQLDRAKQLKSAVSDLPEGMQAFGKRRSNQLIQDTATQGLPEMQGLDPQYNGAFGEANRLGEDRANYEQEYQKRLEAFQTYAATHKENAATAHQAIEALETDHQKRMLGYDKQIGTARRAGYQELYGNITDIVGTFAGEQSSIYKGMFAASKAFAIADSIISIQQGIANAFKLPFPANVAAAATVASETAGIVSTIQSTQANLSGQAHDGIDSVPNSGTWNLEQGERVVDQRTNRDLTGYLKQQTTTNNRSGDRSVTISAPVTVQAHPGMSDAESRRQGEQIGQGVTDSVRAVLVDEKRPGGLLSTG